MFISFSNGTGSAFENSLDSGYPFASVPARDVQRQRCWKRGACSGDGQSLWDYCTARLSDLSMPLTGEVWRSPEPSARPSAAADSEEREICTRCLFAESVGLCLCFLPSCAMVQRQRCWKRGSGDGQRLSHYDYDTTERSFNAVEKKFSVLPSARICPYFYGNSTCNPQYGNAVVDSANLKKNKNRNKFQSQTSFSFKLTTCHARGSIGELNCCWPTFGYSIILPETRYYFSCLTPCQKLESISGALCLVFNDHVWATKFPTAQEEEGEKSWSFLVFGAFTRLEFRRQKKRARILPSALVAPLTSPLTMAT